jgi:hypothetical protein
MTTDKDKKGPLSWMFGGSKRPVAPTTPVAPQPTVASDKPTVAAAKAIDWPAELQALERVGVYAPPSPTVRNAFIGPVPTPPVDSDDLVDYATNAAAYWRKSGRPFASKGELVSYVVPSHAIEGNGLRDRMGADPFVTDLVGDTTPERRQSLLRYIHSTYGRDVAWRLYGPSTYAEPTPNYDILLGSILPIVRDGTAPITSRSKSAYCAEALHDEVCAAVQITRSQVSEAIGHVLEAVQSAGAGKQSANFGRAGKDNYVKLPMQDGTFAYEGTRPKQVGSQQLEWIGLGVISSDGFPIYAGYLQFVGTVTNGKFQMYRDPERRGHGVEFGGAAVKFAGDWAGGERVSGVRFDASRNADFYLGDCRRHGRTHGMTRFPDGRIEEGADEFMTRSAAVMWGPSGEVVTSGVKLPGATFQSLPGR